MRAYEPAPPKGRDAWIPENHPDLSTSCPPRISHIDSFLHILHTRFFPRSISVHHYDLSLSCYFYITYVKCVRIFKSSLFHKQGSGEVLESACDFIFSHTVCG